MTYVHTLVVSTVSHHTMTVHDVSKLSLHVAHGSVKGLPCTRFIGSAHVRLITGAVVSTTFTVLVICIALLSELSTTS